MSDPVTYQQDGADVTICDVGHCFRAHVAVEDWRGRRWGTNLDLNPLWSGQDQAAAIAQVIGCLKHDIARSMGKEAEYHGPENFDPNDP